MSKWTDASNFDLGGEASPVMRQMLYGLRLWGFDCNTVEIPEVVLTALLRAVGGSGLVLDIADLRFALESGERVFAEAMDDSIILRIKKDADHDPNCLRGCCTG